MTSKPLQTHKKGLMVPHSDLCQPHRPIQEPLSHSSGPCVCLSLSLSTAAVVQVVCLCSPASKVKFGSPENATIVRGCAWHSSMCAVKSLYHAFIPAAVYSTEIVSATACCGYILDKGADQVSAQMCAEVVSCLFNTLFLEKLVLSQDNKYSRGRSVYNRYLCVLSRQSLTNALGLCWHQS